MAPLAEVFDVGVRLAADLGQFRRDLTTGAGDAADGAATTAGDRFKKRLSMAGSAAGLALGAAISYGIFQGLQQQDANRLLAAQLGATPKEAERLGKLTGQLYAAGFGASMEEVNTALKGVVQNGIAGLDDTDEAIKRAAANVTNLAAVLGEDAARVSAAVSQMLRTGLAESAEEAFDLLTAATQKGINKSEDLLDTMNEYGTVLREVGLDGEQALGLLSQAIQAGARDADTAADALKEFSILAQDGSKKSADAFTALGINAKAAFEAVSGGGAPATAVLDAVLDKLRAMPANAERTALAVALFGTKAEDLGDALFAMNLDTASQALGGFEGAAQRAGDTLASSANAQVDTFVRSLQQELVNALAGVIPELTALGGWLNENLDTIVPLAAAIGGLAAVIWTVNAAMTAWATITAIANALNLISIARTIAKTAADIASTVAAYAVITAVGIWTAAQWLLNAALSANPIGIVVVAVLALVAAIVIAYKNSETFRNIVLTAWEAIKAAGIAVWEYVRPIFEAWWSFAQRMGSIYLWLWREVVVPAMQGIGLAVQVAWAVIQIVFQLWRFYIMEIVVPAIMFLWNNAVKPVIDFIVAYFQFGWGIIKWVFDQLVSYIRNVVVPAYTWLWNMIKTIWGGVADTVSAVWTTRIKPVLDLVIRFITQDIPAAWRRGVDLIGFWWNALKDLAKIPVRFVIETVVNKGIIGTFNKIAGFLPGVSTIKPIDLPNGFHSGGYFDGRLPGAASTRDNMVAVTDKGEAVGLATGEYIVNAKSTAKNLPLLESINRGFADGGLLDAITNPAGWVNGQVSGLIDKIPGGGTLKQIGAGMARKLIEGLISFAKSKLSFGGGGQAPAGFPPWPSSPSAQRGDSGVWRLITAMIRATGPLSGTFGNGYRHRDPLWHGSGRAVDWMGFNQDALATWATTLRPLELIHRTRTRDYAFTRGRNRGSFNNALMEAHRNHIHLAMDEGGPLRHGETAVNLSGQTEQVTPQATMLTVVEVLERLIVAVERVAPGVGRAIVGANAAGLATARSF